MKLALIEIPYGCSLAIAFDQLGMLQHSTVVKRGDYMNGEVQYAVAPPGHRIEIVVRDDAEIEPYNPPVIEEPAPETPVPAPAVPDPNDDRLPF